MSRLARPLPLAVHSLIVDPIPCYRLPFPVVRSMSVSPSAPSSESPSVSIPLSLTYLLSTCRSVVVMTGAGCSAESGVPTFRDAQTGLWSHYDPLELATPEAFRKNPTLVLDWYQWRRSLISKAAPNAGHYALAQLCSLLPSFTLITQNVDGLHAQAGQEKVIEFHGNIHLDKCSKCSYSVHCSEFDSKGIAVTARFCPDCGSRLRPGVVWFHEQIPPEATKAAQQAIRKGQCDVFFSIGTSSLVYPAAELALQAKRAGARLVEINPNETPISEEMDFVLRGKSAEILPAIVKEIETYRNREKQLAEKDQSRERKSES